MKLPHILRKFSSGTFRCFAFTFAIIVLLQIWQPYLYPYFISYSKQIIVQVNSNRDRELANQHVLAEKEWRLHKLERRFAQDMCNVRQTSRKDVAWLTVVVNDAYAVPALVLGDSIRRFSCHKTLIMFVSKDVTQKTRKALEKVGWSIYEVESMDCDWLAREKGRRPYHNGIRGTHTRYLAWSYTQYSKIIYVDADIMLMSSIDELFDINAEFAAAPGSRPGILDPCFNAGLIVFQPSIKEHQKILNRWRQIYDDYGYCPSDQIVLWQNFAVENRWTVLPYAYNVRRMIYRPMKVFHFTCCPPPKPWLSRCRATRLEARNFDGPVTHVNDMVVLFWKYLYEVLEKDDLESWWRGGEFFNPSQEFGNTSYNKCERNNLMY